LWSKAGNKDRRLAVPFLKKIVPEKGILVFTDKTEIPLDDLMDLYVHEQRGEETE
jgi:hypothetical protein